jgi:hypothetical protein
MHKLILLSVILLAGCTPEYTDRTKQFSSLPTELKHCKIYNISNGPDTITVMHCPNSMTTTQVADSKRTLTAVVVDLNNP